MMRKNGIPAVVIGLMTLLSGLPASAQGAYNFDMSSSFYAGNAKMPPGTYSLRQIQEEPEMYELTNTSGSPSVIVETRQSSKTSKGNPEILFNRYGTTDYLEAIETSTGNSVDIQPSAAEKIAAKKGTPQPHSVPTK
jgi:hypothetical protein